jgi:excisionase family DNA binding protein
MPRLATDPDADRPCTRQQVELLVAKAVTDMRPSGLAPLFVDCAEAARLLGVSRSYIYSMTAGGALASTKLGDRRLVPFDSLLAFAARVEAGEMADVAAGLAA